ncbi:MAG: hypothetical protein SFY32_11065 [Bacteroidota bacterium]|nr:hypothetical protein [Bacteroidota bacterium]
MNENKISVNDLVRIYINSFYLISLFGLLQFALGLFGINLFVQQWWAANIPRINGFSYEPSFFATYLIIGWSILFYLYYNKIKVVTSQNFKFYVITLTLLLSSSRTGIAISIASVFLYIFIVFVENIFSGKISAKSFYFITGFVTLLIICACLFIINFDKFAFMLNGIGSHSSNDRIYGTLRTFNTFLESPWIGYSLGGIAPAIAQLQGVIVENQTQAKEFEGVCVPIEILAASGIVGVIFFILFFQRLLLKPINFAKILFKRNLIFESRILKAFAWALIIEMIMLCFIQNILRPYVWAHIALLNFLYFKYEDKFKLIEPEENNGIRISN